MTEVATETEEPVAEAVRQLLVKTHREEFRLTIPIGWKITFSKVNPQAGGHDAHALRIYESDNQQRACFTGVESFRDLAIPLERRIKKTKTKAEAASDGRGKRSAQRDEEVEFEWVAEAEIPPGDPSIPF